MQVFLTFKDENGNKTCVFFKRLCFYKNCVTLLKVKIFESKSGTKYKIYFLLVIYVVESSKVYISIMYI